MGFSLSPIKLNRRTFAYLMAQYMWAVFLGLALIGTIQFKIPIKSPTIESKKSNLNYGNESTKSEDNNIFDSNKEPVWFLHFTDIHLSTVKNNYNDILWRFNRSLTLFKPDQIFLTGDICDSWLSTEFPCYFGQMEADWNLYKRLLKELNIQNPVHIAGNHDLFNVFNFESKTHYANNLLYNSSTFLINRIPFDDTYNINDTELKKNDQYGDLSFLTINPYKFPSPSVYLIWWIAPPNSDRKKIVNELDNKDAPLTIALTHIPARMWFPSLKPDLENSHNVRLLLTGHLHPAKPMFLHHGSGTVEVVGTPLFLYEEIGMIVVDNNQFSYHQHKLRDEKFAVLTNPIPDYQRSSLEHFDQVVPIRAISFTSGMNLSFRIDDGEVQTLKCEKMKNNPKNKDFELCSSNYDYGKGKHVFTKLGDWSGSFNFTCDNEIESFEEPCYFDEPCTSYYVCFFIYLVFAILITIPFNFVHFADKFDEWLDSEENHHSNNALDFISSERSPENSNSNQNDKIRQYYWILATFAGFFVVKARIKRLPLYAQIILFISVFWCFVFPISLFEIEGNKGAFWLWGYIADGKQIFMTAPAEFATFYLVFVITPYLILLSSIQRCFKITFSVDKKKIYEFHFNQFLIIDILLYIGSFYGVYLFAYELSKDFGTKYGASSPSFVIIPILLFLLLIICIVHLSILTYKSTLEKVSVVPLVNKM